MDDQRFYCTWCSAEHDPDAGTLLDARYAIGRCGKYMRQLVRDPDEADRLARTVGQFKPKPDKGKQLRIADAAQTRALQQGGRHGL
jgi:hypothetical protein